MSELPAIRHATGDDVAFMTDVFLRAMRVHITAARGYWDEVKERTQFREQLQLQHTRIIEHEGVHVGFFMAVEREQDTELHTLCITPEHQGRGLGTTVTRQLIDDARVRKRSVVLSVLKANMAARSFYERLGFVLTDESTYHYRMRLAL
jgi:ribosomal protein S18 acetylase RimI-like enzyme